MPWIVQTEGNNGCYDNDNCIARNRDQPGRRIEPILPSCPLSFFPYFNTT